MADNEGNYIYDQVCKKIKALNDRERNTKDIRGLSADTTILVKVTDCNKYDYEYAMQTHRMEIELLTYFNLLKIRHNHIYTNELARNHNKLEQRVNNDEKVFNDFFMIELDRINRDLNREEINKKNITPKDPNKPGYFELQCGIIEYPKIVF